MIFVVWGRTGGSVQFGAESLAEYLDAIKTHLGDRAVFDPATYEILYHTQVTKIETRSGRLLFLTKPPGHKPPESPDPPKEPPAPARSSGAMSPESYGALLGLFARDASKPKKPKEPEYDPREYPLPPPVLHLPGRTVTRCQADDDDMCTYERCPQLRDTEPATSGRHCPLDKSPETD